MNFDLIAAYCATVDIKYILLNSGNNGTNYQPQLVSRISSINSITHLAAGETGELNMENLPVSILCGLLETFTMYLLCSTWYV